MTTSWIRQPALYEAARKVVESRISISSASFWRRVYEEYIKKGGRLEETETVSFQEGEAEFSADSNER